jgi:hypothetical protein
MPQRTALGVSEKTRLLAFKSHLESLQPASGDAEALQDEFERGLPYAVIFRHKKQWVNKFSSAGVRTPGWWTVAAAGCEEPTDGRRPLLAENREVLLESLSILSSAVGESPAAGSGG